MGRPLGSRSIETPGFLTSIHGRRTLMKRFPLFRLASVTAVGLVALIGPARGHASGDDEIYVTEIPQGYRDYRLISVAHEAGNLNSLGAILGNDVAIKAYRDGR